MCPGTPGTPMPTPMTFRIISRKGGSMNGCLLISLPSTQPMGMWSPGYMVGGRHIWGCVEGIQLYGHWIASICQIYTQCVNPAPNPPPHCHCHAMYIEGIEGFHKTRSTYIPHNEDLLVGPPSDLQHLKCRNAGPGQRVGRRVGCPGHCGSIRDGGGTAWKLGEGEFVLGGGI